jgi:hypothetical protein
VGVQRDGPAEDVAEVTSNVITYYCDPSTHCWVQCLKPDGGVGNPYDRGVHVECYATAVAFCNDKWGYGVAHTWCS